MIPADATTEERRRALLGAVASMHERHDRRQTRATRLRGARIATLGDDPLSRLELAEIATVCEGTVVRLEDGPTVVVRRGRFLLADTQELRSRGVSVVDVEELERMLESYESVYRPESLRKACRRAIESSVGRRLVLAPPAAEEPVAEQPQRVGGLQSRHSRRAA